ncbi:MAG: sulfatase [Polyangiaceae bacterium]
MRRPPATPLVLLALQGPLALLACSRSGDGAPAAPSTSDAAGPAGAPHAVATDAATPPALVSRPPTDLNVVLITIDSLRADMPWAGYPRPIAPRLTDLEKRSVSFTRAYAVSSYTSMSLGGLLGGKLPGELKRDGYFYGTYPKDVLFFPEVLQAAHVHTLGAEAHAYFKDPTFQQGFDRWMVVPDITFKNTTDENVTSPQQEALAEKLLSEKECDGRFFAWFHFMDPHDQYKSHEPEIPAWGKSIRDRYDGEVTFTDKYVGRLLDFIAARPWGARTAIIVSADHGEAFGEHGQYSHGFELWDNLVRVPLFVLVPGAKPRHVDAPTSAIDLAPTIVDLFGLPREPGFEGESLVPEIYGAPPNERDVVLDLPATSDSDRRRAIVHGHEKLIAFGEDQMYELFDLDADPTEEHPITKGDEFHDMVLRYRAFEKNVKDVPPYGCREGCLGRAYLKKDGGA